MQKGKLTIILITVSVVFLCGKGLVTPYSFPQLEYFPKIIESETNPLTVEGAALGRFLFYDPILSADSSLSCAGCHDQKSAFSDAPKALSQGINSNASSRNTMSLSNLAWHPAFFYDGRVVTLEDQVEHPLLNPNEMNSDWGDILRKLNKSNFYRKKFHSLYRNKAVDSTQVRNVIAQFLRTLISHESKFDKMLLGKVKLTEEEFNGFRIMNDQTKGDCLHCHPTDGNRMFTTMAYSNNGLDSIFDADKYIDKGRGAVTGIKKDNGKFMIPSLRNIALTAPYMHDGRFKTLEEVMEFYTSGVHVSANIDSKMGMAYQKGVKLTDKEKREVIAFLKTLTDSVFINKKEFSNPFIRASLN
ncbi:MAG TPA: cytochrome c peroxidase [Bacteroidia bacterium]|jgi:cytochrome c peroxidase